jgi:putative transcriptional regulator
VVVGSRSPTLIVMKISLIAAVQGLPPTIRPMPRQFQAWRRQARRAMDRSMEKTAFLSGQFLLAMPGMSDPRFARAAIAMCSHDSTGAIGIGLGATIEGIGFHDLLEQFEIAPGDTPNAPVHFGGPVDPRRGFVLHSCDWSGQGTVDVAGRWALSSTVDVLRAIAEGAGPRRWVAALGYAGWDSGQLEGELARPGWFNVRGDDALLFETAADARWTRAFAAAGVDPRLLVAQTGTA